WERIAARVRSPRTARSRSLVVALAYRLDSLLMASAPERNFSPHESKVDIHFDERPKRAHGKNVAPMCPWSLKMNRARSREPGFGSTRGACAHGAHQASAGWTMPEGQLAARGRPRAIRYQEWSWSASRCELAF